MTFCRFATLAFLTASAVPAFGQSSIPSENRLFAIVNAHIEVGDGRKIDNGTIVVRDGLIASIGTNIAVPTGADVFDAKGLSVYPGFIDAYTNGGLQLPPDPAVQDNPAPRASYASAAMRVANRKGIRPEVEARQYLQITEDFAKPYRAAGFTTLMIAPGNGYIGGPGTLVNLSGRPAREAIVLPKAARTIDLQWNGGGDSYPYSLLGHIAHVRQTLLDAQWYQSVNGAFRGSGPRPPSDIALEALIADHLPNIFSASTPAQIDRALDMAAEFKMGPMILGGQEAYRRLDRIKAMDCPVLLSLTFGAEPKALEPPKNTDPQTPDDPGDAAPPELPERLAERSRLFQEAVHNAQVLSAAGVAFAFTDRGAKDIGDFMNSLRVAVKNGLSRDAALRALTWDAAKIFRAKDLLGTLEVGKVANLSVMTGDFLDEKTKVKMLYIDGYKINPDRKSTPATPRPSFGGEVGR